MRSCDLKTLGRVSCLRSQKRKRRGGGSHIPPQAQPPVLPCTQDSHGDRGRRAQEGLRPSAAGPVGTRAATPRAGSAPGSLAADSSSWQTDLFKRGRSRRKVAVYTVLEAWRPQTAPDASLPESPPRRAPWKQGAPARPRPPSRRLRAFARPPRPVTCLSRPRVNYQRGAGCAPFPSNVSHPPVTAFRSVPFSPPGVFYPLRIHKSNKSTL